VRYRVQFADGDTNGGYAGAFTEVIRTASTEICPAALGAGTNMIFLDDFTLTAPNPAAGRRFYKLKVIR
jgi:GT2 family glycosyltransferase